MDKVATTELAPAADTTPAVPQLPNHKVKLKLAGQRACNEKDEKNKPCGGHLKHWFYAADVREQQCGDIIKAWGSKAEVYRCETCKTLYLPNPADPKVNVAGVGRTSIYGFVSAREK